MVSPSQDVQPKLGLRVARQIEDQIAELGWPVGQVIASETELLERFDVSRAVLREAIRIVEHTGAARMRRGGGGGLMVTEPNRQVVATAAGVYFASLGVTVGEIGDALNPLMLVAVDRAAQNPDVDAIRQIVDSMDEMAAYRRLGAHDFIELQQRVIALCGNPVLVLLAEALGDVLMSRLHGTRARLDPPLTIDDALRQLRGYRRMLEAIAAGDPEAATASVRVINRAVADRLRDRAAQPRRRPPSTDEHGKLGERVARLIRDDIERGGWQVGSLLGSEAELLEQYDVSRAALREAIRILEYHGAVSTRRGPGGGLFVTQPDAGGIVNTARVVIDYEGVGAHQIWDAREVVEEVCVELASKRLDETGKALLDASLRDEAATGAQAVTDHIVHHALAVATQNRPLVLFVDTLAELSVARVRSAMRKKRSPSLPVGEAHRAHELIVEAVVEGDGTRAAGRMRRHIRAAAKSY
jgi:DNA-binding FadR family transcriptional regulator